MAEGTDRYTATRLSAELGLDNRKMRDILTCVNPVQVKGRSKLYLMILLAQQLSDFGPGTAFRR